HLALGGHAVGAFGSHGAPQAGGGDVCDGKSGCGAPWRGRISRCQSRRPRRRRRAPRRRPGAPPKDGPVGAAARGESFLTRGHGYPFGAPIHRGNDDSLGGGDRGGAVMSVVTNTPPSFEAGTGLRVALLIGSLAIGGAERQTTVLAQSLAQRGVEVILLQYRE